MPRLLTLLVLSLLLLPRLTSSADLANTEALGAFVDGVMQVSMDQHHVAGAVVGITSGTETLFLKGYGAADIAVNQPVDADTTLFRVGSVTKVFVWLAIMQLVDAGKLDLNTDINVYLKEVEIPATYPQPITLAHLMTHTAGFEDLVIDLFADSTAKLGPLSTVFNRNIPTRVRPPGQYASYSNHGVALAGLIIEDVTGEPWESYVERTILVPLGMNQTSMRQPLPENLLPQLSEGYSYEAGRFSPQAFELIPLSPAGAASASGADMLKLARFFLNADNHTEVLSTPTKIQMQQRLFQAMPDINGMAHGLYEISTHGERIVGHGGDTILFHTQFSLFPERQLGFFITTNSFNGALVREAFTKAFLTEYFPAPATPPTDFPKSDVSKIAGNYGMLRHSHSDPTKLMRLFSAIVIVPDESGGIMSLGGFNPENPTRFHEIAPGIFKANDSDTRIAFAFDDNGVASHLYVDFLPVIAFGRLEGAASVELNNLILGLAGATFLWILVIWTIGYFRGRSWLPPEEARFRLAAWLMAGSVFAMVIVALAMGSNQEEVIYQLGTLTRTIQGFSYVTLTLVLITCLLAIRLWSSQRVPTGRKLRSSYIALVGLGYAWFAYYWQFL